MESQPNFHDQIETAIAKIMTAYDRETEIMIEAATADMARTGGSGDDVTSPWSSVILDEFRDQRVAYWLKLADQIRTRAYAMHAKMRGTPTYTVGPKSIN